MRNLIMPIALILLLVSCNSTQVRPNYHESHEITESMEFWQEQRRGANGNLRTLRPQWFQAARDAGIEIIRFNSSWMDSENQDFLMGDVDHFTEIDATDLELLIAMLDQAHQNDLKIILTMFELPGRRCFNEVPLEEQDFRLWSQEEFQLQAFEFWRQLALAVKDHPAIVAYDILNEPHPELAHGFEQADWSFEAWLRRTRGTTWDLNLFNRKMVASIREVDPHTPIILEGYFYADPMGMPYLEPIDDPGVLYSFHNPAPWQLTSRGANNGKYSYPHGMPSSSAWNSSPRAWTLEDLEEKLEPVHRFIQENHVPPSRIIASEFWCDRRVQGCAEYFEDLISLYRQEEWHWTFYGFREDMAWTGLDYEMGGQEVPQGYWTRVEEEDYHLVQEELRGDNPIWDVLQRGLRE